MIWAAATMCFFGLLQVGEAVSPSDPSFEAVSHLAVSDVRRDTHKNPHFLQVHIKASKTDTFRKGVKKKFERERSVERVQENGAVFPSLFYYYRLLRPAWNKRCESDYGRESASKPHSGQHDRV